MMVCAGWKGKIDPLHYAVRRRRGQDGEPSGGDAGGGREAGGVVPARVTSEGGVGGDSRARSGALFVEAPRPVGATDGGARVNGLRA